VLFRRYVPALIIGASLLLAITFAPSRPSTSSTLGAFPAPTFTTAPSPGSSPDPTVGAAAGPTAGVATSAGASLAAGFPSAGVPIAVPSTAVGTRGSAHGVPTTRGSIAPGRSQPTNSAKGPTAGDTSHCAGSKQFAVLGTAPPCQPTWAGGGNNGGATAAGVTKGSIEVVYYREADSPPVKAIEQEYGIYADPADQSAFATAAQNFINARYELYGRKLHIDFVQSPNACTTSPPDDSCFTNDAKQIVAQYHPFAVFYENNTNEPAFFTAMSSLGVVNWGGWGFPDSFDTQQRPYHYDLYTSGDVQAEEFGDWYCKRLANDTAKYAGPALVASQRKVGILVQDNPLNVASAQHLQQIIKGCDRNGAQLFKYSSDTGTAANQAVTLVSQMKNGGVTTVAYFSDPIAPVYFTPSETSQGYQPENVVVGSGYLDLDPLGQSYDQTQWGHAFGIGDLGDSSSVSKTEAQTVWTDTGHSGSAYSTAFLPWGYLDNIAAGLQQAGPDLNPGTFEKAVLTLPAVGGTRYQPLLKFGPGDYTGVSDYRELYWSPTATSPFNGKPGTYVALNEGARYQQGQEPSGQLSLPAGR
jgi:hypothetical protein